MQFNLSFRRGGLVKSIVKLGTDEKLLTEITVGSSILSEVERQASNGNPAFKHLP